MARAPLTAIVIDPATGNARPGVSVEVRRRADNALATVYSAETGTGTLSNPLATDANGRATGAWLERGAYRLSYSGGSPAIVAYSEPFDAAPAADGSVDTGWAAATFLPIGSILAYGGSTDPAGGGWLICDGRSLPSTTYAALSAVLGGAYGSSAGAFQLPDLRGRAPVGAGQGSGLTNRARGSAFGSEAHGLTAAQTPLKGHGHGRGTLGMNPAASQSFQPGTEGYIGNGAGFSGSPNLTVGGGGYGIGGVGALNTRITHTIAQPAHDLTGDIAAVSDGADAPGHPNVQPSLAVGFIIRAL